MGPPALRAALLDCELGWLPTPRLYRLDVEITTYFHETSPLHRTTQFGFPRSKLTYQHEGLEFLKGNSLSLCGDRERMRA
jgi:hypothetical protein